MEPRAEALELLEDLEKVLNKGLDELDAATKSSMDQMVAFIRDKAAVFGVDVAEDEFWYTWVVSSLVLVELLIAMQHSNPDISWEEAIGFWRNLGYVAYREANVGRVP